jgi:PhnB protein
MSITVMLTVRGALDAASFYGRAFGARQVADHVAPTGHHVVEMAIDDASFFVVEENPDAFNLSPAFLGGTSARVNLVVPDPDAVAARAIAAGGTEIFPVADQPYGMRQGRVGDPFGHHWLIGKPLDS